MFKFKKITEEEADKDRLISLRAARINAGLTQEQAAAAFGISRRNLKTWENDPGEVKLKYLDVIEDTYGYPIDNIDFYS